MFRFKTKRLPSDNSKYVYTQVLLYVNNKEYNLNIQSIVDISFKEAEEIAKLNYLNVR